MRGWKRFILKLLARQRKWNLFWCFLCRSIVSWRCFVTWFFLFSSSIKAVNDTVSGIGVPPCTWQPEPERAFNHHDDRRNNIASLIWGGKRLLILIPSWHASNLQLKSYFTSRRRARSNTTKRKLRINNNSITNCAFSNEKIKSIDNEGSEVFGRLL